jgi:uncharacterized membrane protein YbhN (UPF0104 family)
MQTRWLQSSLKWWALACGVALVIGAIIQASTQVDWSHLQKAEPWQILVMIAAVCTNLVLMGVLWWVIILSFDARPKVGFYKMFALVCASGLLNYLPLRPGLFGRATYLKVKHNLPLRQSLISVIVVMGLATLVLGTSAAIVQFIPTSFQIIVGAVAFVTFCCVLPIAAKRILKREIKKGWMWVPIRTADLLATSLRLWVVFQVIQEPITFDQAILAASAGLFVSLLGITPNGLGLREWAIAGATAHVVGHAGFAAAVIDRGVEAIVVTVVGVWALQRISLRDQQEKMESMEIEQVAPGK